MDIYAFRKTADGFVNTRTIWEKLNIDYAYHSWINNIIRRHGIKDYRIKEKKINKSRAGGKRKVVYYFPFSEIERIKHEFIA